MMEMLLKSYNDRLDEIGEKIQASEELSAYLEDEEDELYEVFREKYEPEIHELHEEIAITHPLQIIAVEKKLLDPKFEGLYLPRILGYAVLRGAVNENYKYTRSQNHLREIILIICNSANFEMIKKRIGQSLQIGFALSSKIWISHLLKDIQNKKVHHWLFNLILPKYQDLKERRIGLLQYKKQFETTHFMTTDFPETVEQMKLLYPRLKDFLMERVQRYEDNSSFTYKITELLQNPSLKKTQEYNQILAIVANFLGLNDSDTKVLKQELENARKEDDLFEEQYFNFIIGLLESKIDVKKDCYIRVFTLLENTDHDDLYPFYHLMNMVYTQGYIHEDTIEAVSQFYNLRPGLSTVNECLRLSILKSFTTLLNHLPESDYTEYFELNKTFTTYMNIFLNQEFNQGLKESGLRYVKKLLRTYTDKRGKDYQDIKKFVSSTYVDLGFLNEKQVKNIFKTKRKKRPAKSS